MEEGITQVIWNGFVILTAVLTTLGAIIAVSYTHLRAHETR